MASFILFNALTFFGGFVLGRLTNYIPPVRQLVIETVPEHNCEKATAPPEYI